MPERTHGRPRVSFGGLELLLELLLRLVAERLGYKRRSVTYRLSRVAQALYLKYTHLISSRHRMFCQLPFGLVWEHFVWRTASN